MKRPKLDHSLLKSRTMRLASFFLFSAVVYTASPLKMAYADAPLVEKSFGPSVVSPSPFGETTLTIIFTNPDPVTDTLITAFTDELPSPLAVVPGSVDTDCVGATASSTSSSVTLNPTATTILAADGGTCSITATITAPQNGVYTNIIDPDTLQTTPNGGNEETSFATLTVLMPSVSKSFKPNEISTHEQSILTILFTNPLSLKADLTRAFVDVLPDNLDIGGVVLNDCGGSVNINGSKITLTGASIPPVGNCTLSVSVSSKRPGCYVNHIARGALQTTQGFSEYPTSETLTVCGKDEEEDEEEDEDEDAVAIAPLFNI